MIRFEQVSFGYSGEGSTLEDISFSIPQGQITTIIGANGAGKSTVARLMRGLIRPQSGQIFFRGEDMKTMKASTLAAHMGFLFQNPDRQICRNTVREELLFSLESAGLEAEAQEEKINRVTTALNLDPEAEPFLLSRGERQRVALASALVHQPELLILDEPTTGLDYKECTQIMSYVMKLKEEGVTVVMVCHDMEIVLDYADYAVVMTKGGMLGCGAPKELFRDKELLAKASLLPPQIIGLSILLGERAEGIRKASTVQEMADALEKERKAEA